MRVVAAEQLAALLDYTSLIAALDTAFTAEYVIPPRHHHEISQSATHLLMPAWSAGTPRSGAYLGTKLVNIFSQNAVLGLPSIAGVYVLQSGHTGEPLCVMDGAKLTALRTAAISALAATRLARPESSHMLMVGAGALASELIAAHATARPLRKITLWNRKAESSEKLAATLQSSGLEVEISIDLAEAVAGADIVSVATLAREALIKGDWLKPGTHIDLVGAFNMQMREADDVALQRSSVFVDTPSATVEGGDVALGLKSGAISASDVRADLFALSRGVHKGRASPEEITLFKSVGSAVSDLAAAILVWQRLASA